MKNWQRKKTLLDGIRKALNIKMGQEIENGDDLDLFVEWSHNCCPMQFEPMIHMLKECPQEDPEKYGENYQCHECWGGLLIDGEIRKRLEFIDEK